MVKRKKMKRSRAKIKIKIFLGIVVLSLLLAQPSWHLLRIRSAQDRFDVSQMESEMTWVKQKDPWLATIPLVRDSALWLSLNQGQNLTDQELLADDDDKYRFWLFQLKLQKAQLTEASQILSTITSSSTQILGQGLIDMAQGKYDTASQKINSISERNLSKEEVVLKRLTLSRCLLGQGDETEAEKEWEKAKNVAPAHPLVVEEEFDLALVKADWKKAESLLPQIEKWRGSDSNLDFQAKKALLYLTLGQTAQWEQVLATLSQSSEGKSYQTYLLGVQKYQEGEWQTAQTMLKESLSGQLSSALRRDANQALKQVNERLGAETALQKF